MSRGRGGATELVAALREEMAKRIETGTWRPGQRLPAEPELARSFGVSRPTLREALRSLQEDGFLTRTRGAGTHVTHRPRLKNNLDVNFGVTELIASMGMTPGTQDLRAYEAVASSREAARLSLAPDAPVAVLDRVRTANGEPIVLSRDVIPRFVIEDADGFLDRLGQGSVYERFETELGLVVMRGIASIAPVRATRNLATRLRVPRGSLLLRIAQVDYDAAGRAVLLSDEYHVSDAVEVTVVRRGPGPRSTASGPVRKASAGP